MLKLKPNYENSFFDDYVWKNFVSEKDDLVKIKEFINLEKFIKKGNMISDCDCLTAGIALSNGVNKIVTKNVKHFDRIKDIKAETY